MKKIFQIPSKLSSLMPSAVGAIVVMAALTSSPAMAQVATGAASQGNQTNSSNFLTGSQAIQAASIGGNNPAVGAIGSRGYGLPVSNFATQAGYTFNQAGLPSGAFNYGFTGGSVASSLEAANARGGQSFPTVSLGSNDLNSVDLPFLRAGGGIGSNGANMPLFSAAQQAINATMQAEQALNSPTMQNLYSQFGL